MAEEKIKELKELRVNRINPHNVSAVHVNDMLVSHDGKEFFLHFLEIEPPVFLKDEELEKLESIDAVTKVKLVISPEFAEAVVKALSETIEKFKLIRK